MKLSNIVGILIVAGAVYSCSTRPSQEIRDQERNKVIAQRIEILKQAETSTNPAILQQVENIKLEIEEENKELKIKNMPLR